MTKFFQDTLPVKVWDPVRNRVSVIFKNGEYETDDPALADLLIQAGYRHNGVFQERESNPIPVEKDTPEATKPKMVRKRNESFSSN